MTIAMVVFMVRGTVTVMLKIAMKLSTIIVAAF